MIRLWLVALWEPLTLALLRTLFVWLRFHHCEQLVASRADKRGYTDWEKKGKLWWPKK